MKHKRSLKPSPILKASKRINKRKCSTDGNDYKLGVDLVWVKFPMQDHAAWPYLDRPASTDSKIWVRWESTGADEEIARDRIQELSKDRNSRRRQQRFPEPKQQKTVVTPSKRVIKALLSPSPKPTLEPKQRCRKDPHPQQWPHAPYSEATVQSREIQLGDYVHRGKDLFRVVGMSCFYYPKTVFRDFLTLVNVRDAQQVVYEYTDRVEPGKAE